MRIIVATKNQGKVREIKKIFKDIDIDIITQEEAGISIEVEETGDTFEKNAMIKAKAVSLLCDDIVIADDSGLCVDALDGRPGVYSARYAGENATDAQKIEKLLSEMEGIENRSAKFVSAIALVMPDGKELYARGEVPGEILLSPEGDGGFGYDPIFYSTELQKCFGVASLEEKNTVSHRARGLSQMYKKLLEVLDA